MSAPDRTPGRTTGRTHDRRPRSEGGFVAGGEMLLLGSLVFLVGVLLAVNAWNVVDARMTADAVAREVARTLVEAQPRAGLDDRLHQVAAATMAAMGRTGPVELAYVGSTGNPVADPNSLLRRCDRVTVRAAITVDTVRLPFVGSWGMPWTMTGDHHEVVDPYRTGLPGEADCGS